MFLIENALEAVALFDFVLDAIVAIQLWYLGYCGWMAMSINAALAPLCVGTVQMIQFLLDRNMRRDKT